MIGKLKGIIDFIGDDHLIIDVSGVGYLVFASSRTLGSIGEKGAAAQLFIETHVREDHIHLYGFASQEEKQWFGILQTVQGVGAKLSLAILSALAPAEIANAITLQDKSTLNKVSGVGPKLAVRLLTELKDKVGALPTSAIQAVAKNSCGSEKSVINDAVSALTNLGITKLDAFVAVNKVANDDMPLSEIITKALKEVAK